MQPGTFKDGAAKTELYIYIYQDKAILQISKKNLLLVDRARPEYSKIYQIVAAL